MADRAVDNLLAALDGKPMPYAGPGRSARVMRVAVVDIGTNSTRLLVADVADDGGLTERRAPHDGHAARRGRRRSGRARPRTPWSACSPRSREYRGDHRRATAPSGRRRAHQRGARRRQRRGLHRARARATTGSTRASIGGDEEARLTFLGATQRARDRRRDADRSSSTSAAARPSSSSAAPTR